jgi:zinc protease
MKYKYLLSSLSIALFIAACSPKATTVKQDAVVSTAVSQKLPIDSDVKIGTLPNGLTYYIRKNVEPKNRAELYLVNKIGSIVENDDQQGLAHFTEHMAFNGTKDFPKTLVLTKPFTSYHYQQIAQQFLKKVLIFYLTGPAM